MKKFLAAILTAALIFSPIGSYVFQDHSTTVEARGYKSGKRSFNTNNSTTKNNNSLFQNKKQDTNTNKSKTTSTYNAKKFKPSGLMKGLMLGGLAGLLFGGLFGGMGFFGSILGLLVNVFAIIILFNIIRKIYVMIKDKKKKKAANQWRS
ncbi:hypothetical protein HHO41_19800 [Bacillus sp. DNRA2]|uniref:hypothetical protein n=1 Tax=Bacillus sp. DNRA2 TaxID=2723053 RepID=UPI00145DC17E|nr:hypothetical protein [Bacillus sp. DNRA2]NMD72517.1 hypothetical protein [Bacillus sp. DNRA2]